MQIENIKRLLESFYKGETSIEEEKTLLHYFQSKDISEELSEEQEIFLSMYESDSIEVPAGLESNLSRLIDQLAHPNRNYP